MYPNSLLKCRLNCEWIADHLYINIFAKSTKKYVIVDMGSNRGDFAKAFLNMYPASTAVLIEPNPYLAEGLISDFADKNVFILNAAIGSRICESVPFYLSKDQRAGSLNKELAEAHGLAEDNNQLCVRMTTLKEVCSSLSLKKIDLLKLDIEGAEWDVIENFSKEDYKKVDQIAVEFHDFIDPLLRKRTENCIKMLRRYGYLFIHSESPYMHGSPYFNCLFFKKRIAILGLILGFLRRTRSSIAKAKNIFMSPRNT